MSDLPLLRQAFDSVPEPDDDHVAAARAALMRAIAAPAGTGAVLPRRGARRRLVLFGLVSAGTAAAVLAGILAFVLPGEGSLTGPEIAAAAYEAVAPAHGYIRHYIVREKYGRDETWVASDRPFIVRTRVTSSSPAASRWYGRVTESETTRCGTIAYAPALNLVAVSRGEQSATRVTQADDPIRDLLLAYRRGTVRYRSKVEFKGIPAYKLSVIDPKQSSATYIVRRDDYRPLEIRYPDNVFTFFSFQQLPRTKANEGLLQIRTAPHPLLLKEHGAIVGPSCAGFGSYGSIIAMERP